LSTVLTSVSLSSQWPLVIKSQDSLSVPTAPSVLHRQHNNQNQFPLRSNYRCSAVPV